MSDTTLDNGVNGGTIPATGSQTADGSPANQNGGVTPRDDAQTTQDGGGDLAPDDGGSSAGGSDADVRAQMADAQRRIDELTAFIVGQQHARNDGGSGEPQRQRSKIDEALAAMFGGEDPADPQLRTWSSGLRNVVAAGVQEAVERAVSDMEARYAKKFAQFEQVAAETAFGRTLSDHGVQPRDAAAAAVLSRLEKNSAFRVLREKAPDAAAQWAAAEIKSSASARTTAVAARQQVDAAKGAKLNGSAPRGSAAAVAPLVVHPNDPDMLAKVSRYLRDGGSKESIRLATPKPTN